MKTLFTAALFFFNIIFCFSQDTMTKKSGEDIQAKIMEITETEIKYKKFDNLNGPTYIITKSELVMIRYENGTKDLFNESPKMSSAGSSVPGNSNADEMYKKGQFDAAKYYKGYKGAGTGTLLTSLVSPLIGLVPAIACASTSPKDENLMYPSAELMKQTDYANGYKGIAKKTKKNRIWTNWGIGLGINIAAALILLE